MFANERGETLLLESLWDHTLLRPSMMILSHRDLLLLTNCTLSLLLPFCDSNIMCRALVLLLETAWLTLLCLPRLQTQHLYWACPFYWQQILSEDCQRCLLQQINRFAIDLKSEVHRTAWLFDLVTNFYLSKHGSSFWLRILLLSNFCESYQNKNSLCIANLINRIQSIQKQLNKIEKIIDKEQNIIVRKFLCNVL